MLTRKRRQEGDTLIEVLFAITVLSLAIVMSLSIMNQGTSTSLRSLQITLVRQEIDSQAEALRFLNSSYVAAYTSGYTPNTADATTSPAEEYYKIIQHASGGDVSVSKFGDTADQNCRPAPDSSFILNPRTARYQSYSPTILTQANTFAQLTYNESTNALSQSQGLWIEALRSAPRDGTSYIDFHIRACWGAPGLNMPMNLGTIVRLYDPAV